MNFRFTIHALEEIEKRKIPISLVAILRTVFEIEAETRILPLAFDLSEEAETRTLSLAI